MDRTAWIVVTLCVIGLIVWQIYVVKQTPRRPAPVTVAQPSPSPAISSSIAPLPGAPAPVTTPTPAEVAASFPEKIETLRNSDVELRLTNRGGGIKEAVLLKQIAEKGQRVVLNSSAPIGAIIEQPS